MGGYCFFMDEKMCVGLDVDKKKQRRPGNGKDRRRFDGGRFGKKWF